MKLTINNLTKQINKYENKLVELKQQRQKICPHNNIKYNSWCDDDYASFHNRTYSDSYECLDCGLYAYSENKNDNYYILQKAYNDNY